jgi:hypothetical protein
MDNALRLSRFNKYIKSFNIETNRYHTLDTRLTGSTGEAYLVAGDVELVHNLLHARDERLTKMRHDLRLLCLAMEETGANAIAIGVIRQILTDDTEELLKEELRATSSSIVEAQTPTTMTSN